MPRFSRVILAGLIAAGGVAQAQTPSAPPVVPPSVAIADPSADLLAGWNITCAVRPSRIVQVASKVNGIIASVNVRPGSQVRTGDVLATFDTDVAATDLALAQARADDQSGLIMAQRRLDGLTSRLARMENARRNRAIPEADYDAAALERDMASGELARARADLVVARIEADRAALVMEKSVVRSPVDGTVAEGLIDPGETPGADQPIATITVTDPLRIEAYVPAGALAEFIARPQHRAAIGGQLHDVTLDYVSAVADLSSSTISVFFTLQAPDVIPGLDCMIPPPSATQGN